MTKLCARGKAAAKRKFKVYPSAYANAYASKICAGKAKDPSGLRRKDWGPKKKNKGGMAGAGSGQGRLEKSGLDMDAVKKITNRLKSLKKVNPKNKPIFQKESDLPRSMRIDTTTSITGVGKKSKDLSYKKGPFRPSEHKGKLQKGPFMRRKNEGKYKKAFKDGGMVREQYTGSHIKSDLAGEKVSNKSYESYYKDLL